VLSRRLDAPAALWMDVIRATLPPRLHAANEAAFELGRQTVRD